MANNLTAIISADTTGFKKSIQDAKNVLKDYTNIAKNSSKEIKNNASVSSEQVAAYNRVVNALEKVNSGSLSTARAQKELSNQIKELKIQWANLSEETKNSDFGKSISGSLNSAKQQLNTLKTQLKQTSNETKGTAESSTKLSDGFSGLMLAAKKFLPVIGAAAAAQQAFKSAVNSSQTVGDAWTHSLDTAKGVVKELAYAITNFDFSAFSNGLSDLINKGYEAANAIDQLGNTIMSYDVKTAKANQKLASARAVLYDPDSTKEQKEQAKKDMKDALNELKASAAVLVQDYEDVLIKEINARGGSLSGNGALSIIDKWLEVNATEGRDKVKAAAETGYKAYTEELQKLQGRYTVTTSMYSPSAGNIYNSQLNRTPEYERELSALNDKYKDQIAYHVLLEKYTDEELKTLGEQRIAMINLNGQVSSYEASMNRLNNRKSTSGGSDGGNNNDTVPTVTATKGSELYFEQMKSYYDYFIKKHTELRRVQVYGTEEWKKQDDIIKSYKNKLEDLVNTENTLIAIQRRANTPQLEKITPLAPIVGQVQGPKQSNQLAGISAIVDISKLKENLAQYDQILSDFNTIQDSYDFGLISQDQAEKEIDKLNKKLQKLGIKIPVELETEKIEKQTDDLVSTLGSSFNSIASIFSSLGKSMEMPELDMIGIMAGAIASILQGYAVASAQSASAGPIAWAAFTLTGLATVIGVISQIKSLNAGSYAEGGIISGPTSIGDYNLARVNSGEMILNGSQQARLFSMLNNGGLNGGKIETTTKTKIEGSDLLLISKNYMKKMDKI